MAEEIKTKISMTSLRADFAENKNSKNTTEKKEDTQTKIVQEEVTSSTSWEWIIPTEIINENNRTQTSGWENTNSNELFTNYTPIFEKRRISFLERLEKLKNKVKTNYVFVLITILVWGIFIWGIIFITPQYHSFSIYKASILNIVHTIKWEKEIPIVQTGSQEKEILNEPLSQTWVIVQQQEEVKQVDPTQTWWTNQNEQQRIERNEIGREKIKAYFKKR